MIGFAYREPQRLTELFELMESFDDGCSFLAGGTDLVNHIRFGKRSPKAVISLRRVAELDGAIRVGAGAIRIGALTTLTDIERHPLLGVRCTALVEAAARIGSRQIRNTATLVGNLCNASPAADSLPALLVLEATVEVAGREGMRMAPLEVFLLGPGKTDLKPGEIVVGLNVPLPPEVAGSCYLKAARREGADLTTVGAAVMAMEDGEIRIGLGAVAPVPYRAYEAEKLLCSGHDIDAAVDAAARQARPISDLRGSREYRIAMIKVFVRRALAIAEDRKRGTR